VPTAVKKLAAIVLLLLLLFNLAGYKLWFYYVQEQSDAQLVKVLDKQLYDYKDLIALQIPLSLPYQTDQKDFERVDGEIKINGQVYKYVMRKVQQGKLIVLCLPDRAKTRLETAKDDFFKVANSLQAGTPVKKSANSNTLSLSNLLSEFDTQGQNWLLKPFIKTIKYTNSPNQVNYATRSLQPLDQPPEMFMV
jgi:hypothetical protein